MRVDLSYVKEFDYIGGFKKKTYQYFQPIFKLFSHNDKQVVWSVLDDVLVKKLQEKDFFTREKNPNSSCNIMDDANSYISILDNAVLLRLRVKCNNE